MAADGDHAPLTTLLQMAERLQTSPEQVKQGLRKRYAADVAPSAPSATGTYIAQDMGRGGYR